MTKIKQTVTAAQFKARFPAMLIAIRPIVSADLLDCIIAVGEDGSAIDADGAFNPDLFQQLVEECMTQKAQGEESEKIIPVVYLAGVVTGMAISQYIMQ